MTESTTTLVPEAVTRLRRDLRAGASALSERQARFLVDAYYVIQTHRIEAGNQLVSLVRDSEPFEIIEWLRDQHWLMEREVAKVLGEYAGSRREGQWALGVCGIGPILAAGLLAHIDISQAPTAGHIWSYAGLNPEVRWERGQKRPWNARLKTLCWKIGESFVKVSGRSADVYGKVYAERKELEVSRNEAGEFAEQAAGVLAAKKIGRSTDAYKHYSAGQLPPAHIHARAKRYAVKLFLAHYHHVAYEVAFGSPPPKPYVIEHGGHTHWVKPPNW
jgi:hypothetical protein